MHNHPIKLYSAIGLIVTVVFWSNLMERYNQKSLLQLGFDMKYAGDNAGAVEIIKRINSFAPDTQEAKDAVAQLK
jgi:hypothetical protein